MSSYLTPLLVALGGALGALTRYTVTLLAASFLGSSFPYGTLLVNGAGSFLIGLLAFFFTQHFPSPLASAFLVTGFLGGLTTFSCTHVRSMPRAENGTSYCFASASPRPAQKYSRGECAMTSVLMNV